MQLNLPLIRVLMRVIKYITMSQLENTETILHFNWYPPRATWAPHILSAFWVILACRAEKWSLFLLLLLLLLEHSHWGCTGVCGRFWLYISWFLHFASNGTLENSSVASHYKPRISQDTVAFCLLNGNVLGDANVFCTLAFCLNNCI